MSTPSLKTIEPDRSITDQVREAIRFAIIDGELVPGTLYSVQTLADSFGVSRTPVREALIDLSGQGMVRFERNRGVRILQTSIHGLQEIFGLRLLLEVPATHRAAQQLSAQQLKRIRRELDAMRTAAEADDEVTMMHHDRAFHRIINDASGNQRLAEYVDGLRDLVLTRGITTRRSRSLQAIVAEHEAILEALGRHDPDAAAAAMKTHLMGTALLLLKQEGGRDDNSPLAWARLVTVGEAQTAAGKAPAPEEAA